MSAILSTFLAALILAYVLEPIAQSLQRARFPKALGALAAVAVGLAAAIGLLVLFANILQREIPQIRSQLPAWLEQSQQWLGPQLQKLSIEVDWTKLKAQLVDRLTQHLSENTDSLISASIDTVLASGHTFIATLAGLVLVLFIVFYLLVDWAKFFQRLAELIPPRYRTTAQRLAHECDRLLSQYLRGQLVVMLILAAYYALALHALGMAGGVAIGIFTGLAIFIPYIGFGVGLLLALASALLQFGPGLMVLAVATVYVVGQLAESFVLTPKLVGERIGLHPVAVIFALLFFGTLFGFFGVLLALPAAAIALVALRFFKQRYKSSDWYQKDK